MKRPSLRADQPADGLDGLDQADLGVGPLDREQERRFRQKFGQGFKVHQTGSGKGKGHDRHPLPAASALGRRQHRNVLKR
jgi:hypothetical protein